jgi:hypothetical protein
MFSRVFLPTVTRGVVERARRCATAERPVVADISPDAASHGLAFSQDRDSSVIAMQPLGSEHMALDQGVKGLQRHRARSDLIRQR